MKIYRSLTIDVETGKRLAEDSYEYDGDVALCDRAAQGAAKTAGNNAANAAAGYGSTASTASSALLPYYTRQLYNPSGMSSQDIGAQLAAAMGGSGGSTSGLTGQANLRSARSNNPEGFSSALDAAARERGQANAKASEGIAARNANVKLQQQSQAARGLGGLYGMAGENQMRGLGVQSQDLRDQIAAGNTGWLQNMEGIVKMLQGGAMGASAVNSSFMK